MRTSYLLDALNAVNALNAAKTNTWDWKAGEASLMRMVEMVAIKTLFYKHY